MATGTAHPPVENDMLFEVIDGERREVAHMGALAGTLASLLCFHLNAFAIPRRLGLAVVEVLVRLNAGQPSRRPDLAFVSYQRWGSPGVPAEDPAEWEVVPDLAVEVVSPNNTAAEIEAKIIEYFLAGVQLVWVLYPIQRRFYVYETASKVRILTETDELDGGNVLPGFRLKIADLFAPLVQPA